MDDAEIDRLRKAICRSFNSQPHKKKYWLALLDMYVAKQKAGYSRARKPSKEMISSVYSGGDRNSLNLSAEGERVDADIGCLTTIDS
jgi:hypothetical protein